MRRHPALLALLLVLATAGSAHAQSFDAVFSFDFVWSVIAEFSQTSTSGAQVSRSGRLDGHGTAALSQGPGGGYTLAFTGAGGSGAIVTEPASPAGGGAVATQIFAELGSGADFPLPPGVFETIDRPRFAQGTLTLGDDGRTLTVSFGQVAHSNTFGQNYAIAFSGSGQPLVTALEPDAAVVLAVAVALYAALTRRRASRPAPRGAR